MLPARRRRQSSFHLYRHRLRERRQCKRHLRRPARNFRSHAGLVRRDLPDRHRPGNPRRHQLRFYLYQRNAHSHRAGPGLCPDSSVTSMSVTSGQSTATTITLTPLHTFAGTVTLNCSNLPANVICTFNTTQLTTDSTFTPQSTQLTISTNSLSQIADAAKPTGTTRANRLVFATALPFFSLGIFLLSRRGKTKFASLLSACLMCLLPLLTTGCSSSSKALAAPGTYNITVTATNSTQNISHQITIALTVK